MGGEVRWEGRVIYGRAAWNLKVKRVDYFWSTWSKAWKYKNTGSGVVAEAMRPVGNGSDNDPWQNFCFVVVRKFPDPRSQGGDITFHGLSDRYIYIAFPVPGL